MSSNLSSIPMTHRVKGNLSVKLSSDFHTGAMAGTDP